MSDAAIMFSPGGCCKCGCPACDGNVPQQLQIITSGITNGTCDDCLGMNGTFILVRAPLLDAPGYCAWAYGLNSSICEGHGTRWQVNIGTNYQGHAYYIRLFLPPSMGTFEWVKGYTEPISCDTLNDVLPVYGNYSGFCLQSSSTVIQALSGSA